MDIQMWLAVAIFVGAYTLIVIDRIPRVMIALAGAAAMVLIGAADGEDIFFSAHTGIDWNVIFLLIGMMIIVGIMRHTGIFDFVALWAVKRSRGRPFVLMVMLMLITALLSAFFDNVTTVLLIAPVTFLVCDRLAVSPVPYLIAVILSCNIGGAATLIGDPPNIIIGSRAGLTFNDFLVHMAPVTTVLIGVLIVFCRVVFRKHFVYDPVRAASVMSLNEREAITDKPLLIKSLVVVTLVLAGFVLHSFVHIEPSIVAMLGAGLLVLLANLQPKDYFADVEWETLLFFSGLFIMVGSLVNLGIITLLGDAAVDFIDGDWAAASTWILVGGGAISGVIDNIPFATTMTPILEDLVNAGGAEAKPLWWALAFAADMGGIATAVGSAANVVVLGIARRDGHPISFWEYTKFGLPMAIIVIGLLVPYMLLRYF